MRGTHSTGPYTRADGTRVRGYIARNPRRKAAVGVTAAATITLGFLTVTGSLPIGGAAAGGSEGASVEISADLNQAVAALAVTGLHGDRVVSSSVDCAGTSTGLLQSFFIRNPCKKLVLAALTAHSPRTSAQIEISWVTMPSASLAIQYKRDADAYGTGNPPGSSGRFNGLCYASGRNGATVWTVQVQPIGRSSVDTDRAILKDAAPAKLGTDYLQQHCIG
jgi:hypothetical protein